MHDAYLNAHLGKLDIKLGIKYTDSSTCASSMAALKQLRGGGGGGSTNSYHCAWPSLPPFYSSDGRHGSRAKIVKSADTMFAMRKRLKLLRRACWRMECKSSASSTSPWMTVGHTNGTGEDYRGGARL
jgi:hypothetical protein